MSCIFCNMDPEIFVMKNEIAFVINDKFPLSKGHLLIIPFRHYENYFDSTVEELRAITELIVQAKQFTDNKFQPDGYNVNINVGKPAGQIIMHAHVHLIPRY